jgi:hypothetical protein
MMKHKLCKALITANILRLLLFTGGMSQAFDTSALIAPREAELAAQKDLQRFLNSISDWELNAFNFHSRDEFKSAKVGTPFRVFVASPDDVLRGDPKKTLLDLVHPLPEWFFPVISKDEFRTILDVAVIKNEWKAGGIGHSDLAKSFAHVMTKWPASKGYSYVFVRNYQTLSEFIILIHPQKTSVIPLPNAIKVWGLKGEKVLEQSEALFLLKNSLNKVNRHKKGLLDRWLVP